MSNKNNDSGGALVGLVLIVIGVLIIIALCVSVGAIIGSGKAVNNYFTAFRKNVAFEKPPGIGFQDNFSN